MGDYNNRTVNLVAQADAAAKWYYAFIDTRSTGVEHSVAEMHDLLRALASTSTGMAHSKALDMTPICSDQDARVNHLEHILQHDLPEGYRPSHRGVDDERLRAARDRFDRRSHPRDERPIEEIEAEVRSELFRATWRKMLPYTVLCVFAAVALIVVLIRLSN